MHIFGNDRGRSQAVQNPSNPMQLIRTRSASDRFPAFTKAASRSQISIQTQRTFNRSMSAQEAEEGNSAEPHSLGGDQKSFLQASVLDDKENIADVDSYNGQSSWFAVDSQASNHSNPPLRNLHYAHSMTQFSAKKEGFYQEHSHLQPHRSPLRERRQKLPLSIKAPAPPSFNRPRAKSSASFNTIHSPPPCPPPSTPLPELPPCNVPSTIGQKSDISLDKLSINLKVHSTIKDTPFEQAWRCNNELMDRYAASAIQSASSTTSSSSTTSPISSGMDDSGEISIMQLHEQHMSLASHRCDTQSKSEADLLFQNLGLSSFADQFNNANLATQMGSQFVHTMQQEVNDDHCVYGVAM